jgi:hypothetical protein
MVFNQHNVPFAVFAVVLDVGRRRSRWRMAAAWIVNLYRNCSGGKEGSGCDVIDRKEARRGERKKRKIHDGGCARRRSIKFLRTKPARFLCPSLIQYYLQSH